MPISRGRGRELQGDPPEFLKPWFDKHGDKALKRLAAKTDVSAPTLRKIYRSLPVRGDVAVIVARALAGGSKREERRLMDLMMDPSGAADANAV